MAQDVKKGKVKPPEVKGEGKKAAETMYVRTTTRHLVTCELDGAVFENYKELKDHVGRDLGMSM